MGTIRWTKLLEKTSGHDRMGWIYMITNKANGKCYVGQTSRERANDRWSAHRCRPSGCLKGAFEKYDSSNFDFSIICEIPKGDGWREELDAREILEIKERNTLTPNGYNIEEGGNRNKVVTKETREKIGAANRGARSPHFGVFSSKHPRSIKVEKWSLDGILLKTYDSGKDAAEDIGVRPASVNQCINGKSKTCGGFIWKKHLSKN